MKYTVLLIEDNPAYADLIKYTLGNLIELSWHDIQYEAFHVNTLESALKKLKEIEFDALLTDLRLPGLEGVQIVKELRAFNPAVPIIVMSAYGDDALGLETLKFGGDDFLHKDQIGPLILRRVLNYAIERRKMAKDLLQVKAERDSALAVLKQVEDLLPICSWCRKIKGEQEEWMEMETFLKRNGGQTITHGICPDCAKSQLDSLIGKK